MEQSTSIQVREDKMKIIEKDFNVLTGEETITERDETKEETKLRLDKEKAAKAYAEAKAQADAQKAAILARLGLTEDELKTILG
jgi:hypothetical protein